MGVFSGDKTGFIRLGHICLQLAICRYVLVECIRNYLIFE